MMGMHVGRSVHKHGAGQQQHPEHNSHAPAFAITQHHRTDHTPQCMRAYGSIGWRQACIARRVCRRDPPNRQHLRSKSKGGGRPDVLRKSKPKGPRRILHWEARAHHGWVAHASAVRRGCCFVFVCFDNERCHGEEEEKNTRTEHNRIWDGVADENERHWWRRAHEDGMMPQPRLAF